MLSEVPFKGEELKMYKRFIKRFEKNSTATTIETFIGTIREEISDLNLTEYLNYYRSLHEKGSRKRINANLAKSSFDRLTRTSKLRKRSALSEITNTVDVTTA